MTVGCSMPLAKVAAADQVMVAARMTYSAEANARRPLGITAFRAQGQSYLMSTE
jgi:hypothetical protein